MKAKCLTNFRPASLATLMLLALMLFSTACRSRKNLTGTVSNENVNRDDKEQVFAAIAGNRFEFEYFSASVVCDYTGAAVPMNINLRMQRGEKIWMSVNAIFFEAARVLITKDSVHIIAHMPDKYVMSRGIEFLDKYLGTKLTIEQVQDVLVGNSIIKHDNNSGYEGTPEQMKITTRLNQFLLQEVFHTEYFRPTLINADETGTKNQLEVIYSDFTPQNSRLVPLQVNIKAVTNTQDIIASLKYSDISTETITDWPFRMPANYERR